MKTYKTNQESINKGILQKAFNFTNEEVKLINTQIIQPKNMIIKIDNRIKGYCLKEVK